MPFVKRAVQAEWEHGLQFVTDGGVSSPLSEREWCLDFVP